MSTKSNKLNWRKHPDGGEYANYKLGTIYRWNKNYSFRLGYNDYRNAKDLSDAKSQIDQYTLIKQKNNMATKKKTATSRGSKLKGTTKVKGLVKFTAKNAHVEGIKRDGTLKKGWKYPGGGKSPVKVKPSDKKANSKKGLGIVTRGFCVRKNSDGSTTTYGESMTAGNPCPRGGVRVQTLKSSGMTGTTKRKKPATAKQKAAQSKFAVNSRKARQLVNQGKAKNLRSAWAIIKKK